MPGPAASLTTPSLSPPPPPVSQPPLSPGRAPGPGCRTPMTDTGPPPPRGAVERQPQTPLITLHTTPPDPPAATCTVTLTQTTTKVGAGFDRESSFVQEDPAGSISMFFVF